MSLLEVSNAKSESTVLNPIEALTFTFIRNAHQSLPTFTSSMVSIREQTGLFSRGWCPLYEEVTVFKSRRGRCDLRILTVSLLTGYKKTNGTEQRITFDNG